MATQRKAKKATLQERFAANVRTARVEAKLSQHKLANKSGLSVSYISMLEKARRSPPLDTVEVVAKALGRDPISLFA